MMFLFPQIRQTLFSSENHQLFFQLNQSSPAMQGLNEGETVEALKPVLGEKKELKKEDLDAYKKQKTEKAEALKRDIFKGKLPDALESQFHDLDTHINTFQETNGYLDRLTSLVQKLEGSLSAYEKELSPQDPKLLDQLKELQEKKIANEVLAFKLTMNHVDALSQSEEGKQFLRDFFIQNGEVDFYGNDHLERKVGLGEIMPKDQQYVLVNGKPAKRVEGLRPYYEDQNGRYVKIFDGYKLQTDQNEIDKNKDSWKFPSEGKDIRAEQLAKLQASNPDLAARVQSGQISKEDFFSVLKTSKVYEDEEELSSEEIDRRKEMKFQQYIEAAFGIKDFQIGEKASDSTLTGIMQEKGVFNPYDQKFVLEVFKAIAKQESSNNYAILGPMITSGSYKGERAIGKYQIMPKNWKQWSESTFGRLEVPTAENQDIIAVNQMARNFMKWKNRGESYANIAQLMAVQWYGNNGQVLSGVDSISDRAATTSVIQQTPKQYASRILGTLKGTGVI